MDFNSSFDFDQEEKALEKKDKNLIDFHCSDPGVNSFAKDNSGKGVKVGQRVSINGNEDLSEIIRFNDCGKVYAIRVKNNPSSFSLMNYKYEIEVEAEGPHGFLTGGGYLRFTDKSGDTYSLSIVDSSRKIHVVDYNSAEPEIVKIEWSNNSF